MNKLISIVGASGVGKTALVQAMSKTGKFTTAYEQHVERPFQALFNQDSRYALANQIDYLLLRAEQERALRNSSQIGLMDGGLDLDFHGFTHLFHSRGLLTDAEYDLCRRLYTFLCADERTVASRLSTRDRINIASAADTVLFNSLIDEWLASLSSHQVVELDTSQDSLQYEHSVPIILKHILME
jgi:deoxyadenosine/deoxycytidine kinase